MQITPAFVREAYTLLRQSIIHVEQDDVDFDEEELEGDRPQNQTDGESQDVQMSSAALEESSMAVDGVVINGNAPGLQASSSSSRAPSAAPPQPPAQQPQRPRMRITHDQYITIQSLVVMYLSEKERETGKGVDKDDLIDWYLESKEEDLDDVDQLEYEKELITKALRKMVKVSESLLSCGLKLIRFFLTRMAFSWKSRVMFRNHFCRRKLKNRLQYWREKMFASITWSTLRWTWRVPR